MFKILCEVLRINVVSALNVFLAFCVFSYVYSIADDILDHKYFFDNQQSKQVSVIGFLNKATHQLGHMAVVALALALEEAFEGACKEVRGMIR